MIFKGDSVADLDFGDETGCAECDGDGWIIADCGEDSCCCLNPYEQHDWYPCRNCNPRGRIVRGKDNRLPNDEIQEE